MLRVGFIIFRRLKRAGLRLSLLGRLGCMLLVCDWFVGIMEISILSSTVVLSSSFKYVVVGIISVMLCGNSVVRADSVSCVLTISAGGGLLAVGPRGDILGRGDLAIPGGDLVRSGGDLVTSHGHLSRPRGDLARPGGDLVTSCGDLADPRGDLVHRGGELAASRGDLISPRGDLALSFGGTFGTSWSGGTISSTWGNIFLLSLACKRG